MKETRIKILNIDRKKVEKKLTSLGATKTCEGEICSTFFDTQKDTKQNKNNVALTIRRIGNKTIITLKKRSNIPSLQEREEYQISTSDFHETKKIIKSLGLKECESTRFYRITYSFKDLIFKFDKYKDRYELVPEFLEIQSTDLDTIYEYAKILGFTKEDCMPITTVELLKKYNHKK